MKPRYFDRQGRELQDQLEWARTFSRDDVRRVALTDLDGAQDGAGWVREPRRVSTIFVGLVLDEADPPLIFETKVLDQHGNELEVRRYATEKEALEGHGDLVRLAGGPTRGG